MPPVHEELNASYWPVFTVGVLLAVRLGVPRAVFTNTISLDDRCVTGVVALSVTPMQYEFVDVGVTVMLLLVADTDEYVARNNKFSEDRNTDSDHNSSNNTRYTLIVK